MTVTMIDAARLIFAAAAHRPAWAAVILGCCMMLLLPGCQSTAANDPALTLRELAPAPIPSSPTDAPATSEPDTPAATTASATIAPPASVPPASSAAEPQWTLLCQRLIFARDSARLPLALTMTDTTGIDPAVAARWAANGLRIGRLDRTRLPLLMANVDRPLDSDVIRIQNPDQFAPVDLINQASPSLRFRYVERPGGRSKIIRMTAGSLQMLLRIVPPLDPSLGPPRLHIVPHHFSPAQTLVPRLPQEKMLDGTTFSDLQLAPPVSDRHVWIVWADLPSSAASIESGDAVTLGQAMFTGHRRKTPIQLLLIIGAQPAAAAPSPAQP